MELSQDRIHTCCFSGHRPDKLPWGTDETAPGCIALKNSISREIKSLYDRGYRCFISGMARGTDLYFAEEVLTLREKNPDLSLECALPCRTQSDSWPDVDQRRWRTVLDSANQTTLVQQNYDRWCMHRRDRYLVDRASVILAAYNGTPGGTMYTLNYAMEQKLEILLLDLNHPGNRATRMTIQTT